MLRNVMTGGMEEMTKAAAQYFPGPHDNLRRLPPGLGPPAGPNCLEKKSDFCFRAYLLRFLILVFCSSVKELHNWYYIIYKHIHPSLNHPPGVLRGVRPLLCPWTQNFVGCFLFCCALESSCLGRLSAIKVQLELELELEFAFHV